MENLVKRPPVVNPKNREVREKKTFSRNLTFNLNLEDDVIITGFSRPTKYTPVIDKSYVFPVDETRVLLLGMMNRDRILITGHSGVGKTALVEQVASRLNYNVFKISFDGSITRNDLVGEWIVKNSNMVYRQGILPIAMATFGSIILLDEWDTINADTSFVIQRLLQREDGKLLLFEKGANENNEVEIVSLHHDNIICATSNTCGQGDDTGLYTHGTRVQNYAQLNRFGITIRMEWLKPEDEEEMILKKFENNEHPLKKNEVHAFVKVINRLRDGFVNHQISVPLSTRDLINWVEKYLLTGSAEVSAKYCFINRMSKEDAEVANGIIQRAFGE